jgi:hypothetical protein
MGLGSQGGRYSHASGWWLESSTILHGWKQSKEERRRGETAARATPPRFQGAARKRHDLVKDEQSKEKRRCVKNARELGGTRFLGGDSKVAGSWIYEEQWKGPQRCAQMLGEPAECNCASSGSLSET